ncbi:MAG: hypothetical protein M3Y71_09900 [Actinomycetota bacterium]|nr:hypothetical protein [Actinomycetota bacterium]
MKSFTKLFESMLTKPAMPTWGTAGGSPAAGALQNWGWTGPVEQNWGWTGPADLV